VNTVLPVEYINSICEIKTKENEFISSGNIIEIESEYIKIAYKSSDMPLIGCGTEIKVNIFNTRLGFRVLIGQVFTSTHKDIKVVDYITLIESERRNFFRVLVDMQTCVILIKDSKASPDYERIPVILRDLSLSGTRIQSKITFERGTVLLVEIIIKGKVHRYQCRVVRLEKQIEDDYYYGCEFILYDDHDNDVLCSYLFQMQREQIQKKTKNLDTR